MRRTLMWLSLAACLVPASEAFAADSWKPTGSLAVARSDHTATLLRDGTVLVAGGRNGGGPLASAEIYDPATGTWSAAGAMAVPREEHTATLLVGASCSAPAPSSWCGKVLVTGGSPAATAELYNPVNRTWSPTGALGTPRARHTATLLGSTGRVLVAGGDSTTGASMPLSSAEVYDAPLGTWAPTGSLATARAGHSSVLLGNSVLTAAGQGTDGLPVGTGELYDEATDTWSPAGTLAVPRREGTLTLLRDGRPMLAGGLDPFSTPRRVSEIYDPTAPGGPWIATGSMALGHGLHTATLLPDGRTLVAGSDPSSPSFSSAELHDPNRHTWSSAPSLLAGRGRHTATLLTGPRCGARCGHVLVAGGRRGITHLASAEVFGPVPVAYPLPHTGRVTDLSATALSSRRVRLAFSAPGWPRGSGLPARRYLVKQARRVLTGSNFERARSLCGGTCSFTPGRIGDRISLTVTGLVPNRLYSYGLMPLDSAGNRGPVSNYVRVRTRRDRIRPGRVRRLSARALSKGRVRLRFRAPASDGRRGPAVRRFQIKQSTRPIRTARAFRRARSLCRPTCRFSPRRVGARLSLRVTGLCGPRTFFYAIRARDEGGNVGRTSRFRRVRVRSAAASCRGG